MKLFFFILVLTKSSFLELYEDDPKIKCSMCQEIVSNNFDVQNFIDQNKCEKFKYTKENCINFIKKIAYNYYSRGQDIIFNQMPDVGEKFKVCKSQNKIEEFKNFNCEETIQKVCDFLQNTNECLKQNVQNQTKFFDKQPQEIMNPIFKQVDYKENKQNDQKQNDLKILESRHLDDKLDKMMDFTQGWQPSHPYAPVNAQVNLDSQLEDIMRLENVVKDLDQKLRDAKIQLQNKVVQAQTSSKLVQEHLDQVVMRIKSEIN